MLDLIPNRVTSTIPLLDHRYRRANPPCSRADDQPQDHRHAEDDGQPRWLDRSRRSTKPSVSVVIPTLNESRNLPYAMWRLPDFVTEVIVVDGRSSDDTALSAAMMRPDVKVVLEPAKGKGAALRRGFAEATGDIIVMLDADGSADGGEIQRFVDVLLAGADFAKGSRFLPGGGSADLTHIRSLGNQALTAMVNLICQTRFSDLCYGYNAFWRDCLDFIDIDVTGFEVETRLMMMVATAGLVMVEVPSWEYDRVHGVSNLKAARDGMRVLRSIWTSTKEIRRGRASVRCQPLGDHSDA
ncbi:MAG TPA: glycosyltransferase family 2 protein [Ilumatobacteraceae bacterium]|jgi:glycosyltransferase involved in cell wall biosynthesis